MYMYIVHTGMCIMLVYVPGAQSPVYNMYMYIIRCTYILLVCILYRSTMYVCTYIHTLYVHRTSYEYYVLLICTSYDVLR